jgi:competence protein ComEC
MFAMRTFCSSVVDRLRRSFGDARSSAKQLTWVEAALVFGLAAPALLLDSRLTFLFLICFLWWFRTALRGGLVLVGLIVLGVQYARVSASVSREKSEWQAATLELRGLLRCYGEAVVLRSPTERSGTMQLMLHAESLECLTQRPGVGREKRVDNVVFFRGRIQLTWSREVGLMHCTRMPVNAADLVPRDVGTGDRLQLTADLAMVEKFSRFRPIELGPGSLTLSGAALEGCVVHRSDSIQRSIDSMRAHARHEIARDFPRAQEPMARALVLGETDLSVDDAINFRTSGLLHLLAVSGMHLILVLGTLERLVRWFLQRSVWLCRRVDIARISVAAMIPLAFGYALFAGGSGSALRAAIMVAASGLARAIDTRATARTSLGWSILAMLAIDPLAVLDVSLGLSALATFGLVAFATPIVERLSGLLPSEPSAEPSLVARLGRHVVHSFGTSLAATCSTMPLMAQLGGPSSVIALALNVVAMPLGDAIALPLCLAHGAVAWVPALGRIVAAAATPSLMGLSWLAECWQGFPVWSLDPCTRGQWLCLALVATRVLSQFALAPSLAMDSVRFWRDLLFVGCMFLCVPPIERWCDPCRGKLCVTFVDVGQGDSAIIQFPDGAVALIDGGGLPGSPLDPGARSVLPTLRRMGVRSLSMMMLSHPHPDHYGGLVAVAHSIAVQTYWDTGEGIDLVHRVKLGQATHRIDSESRGQGTLASLYSDLGAQGTKLVLPPEGCGVHRMHGVLVQVMAPCRGSFDGNANNNSWVVRLTFGERSFLFVGDAEAEEEEALLRTLPPEALRADVLKVGHHGSLTSTSASWVRAVHPSAAVISTGVRNRFAHPRAETVATLVAGGAQILRTDLDGAVLTGTDGKDVFVHTEK